MLKLGSDNVKSLYVGGQKIKKAYVGEDLVFEATVPSRLPAGYTELEYIHVSAMVLTSSGSSGGVLAITSAACRPSNNENISKLYLDYKLDSMPSGNTYATSNATIYGLRIASSNSQAIYNYYSGIYCSSGQLTFCGSTRTPRTIKMSLSAARTKLTVDLSSKLVTVNEVNYALSVTNINEYIPIGNFACDRYPGSIRGTTSHAQIPENIYEAKAWDQTGSLISHTIPALEKSTGNLGMYDIVNNYFNVADNTMPSLWLAQLSNPSKKPRSSGVAGELRGTT